MHPRHRHRLTGLVALLAATLLAGTAPAAAAGPTGQWPLKGTFTDPTGSGLLLTPLLLPEFASVIGANGGTRTALVVEPGDGLEISGIKRAARSTYTIEVQFQFAEVEGYQRILSFGPNDRDAGLYLRDGGISLYPSKFQTADLPIEAGDWVTVRVARNGTTGKMQVFWSKPDMIWMFTYKDTTGRYKLRNGIVDLFQDDADENGDGIAGKVIIWNTYKPVILGHG